MTSEQELYGRKGRLITDQDAKEITRVEELSYDLKVSEVMTRDVKFVTPDMHMVDLLELFRQARISGAPVLSDGKIVGIISLEDLIVSLCAMDVDAPVEKYMTPKVITMKTFDPVVEAIRTFTKSGIGRLPVVDESGKLVGMITKGDVTRGVLTALQRDYQEEEVRRYRASHLFEDIISDRTSLILRYQINPKDFTHGGNASSNIKRALIRLGANPQIARRCGIAVYEAEINLIIHTMNGGFIRVEIEPHRITMKATDDGPGIEDVELAIQPGYSTATEEIRELGFGAGMGLPNIKRCVDRMKLESTPGKGTRLEMYIDLQPEDSFRESNYFDNEVHH
jgi:CBS domain-containing protein/anti-sigma regulatory factor (Ser/Thr protein kinase)